eukprot:gene32398-31570_t
MRSRRRAPLRPLQSLLRPLLCAAAARVCRGGGGGAAGAGTARAACDADVTMPLNKYPFTIILHGCFSGSESVRVVPKGAGCGVRIPERCVFAANPPGKDSIEIPLPSPGCAAVERGSASMEPESGMELLHDTMAPAARAQPAQRRRTRTAQHALRSRVREEVVRRVFAGRHGCDVQQPRRRRSPANVTVAFASEADRDFEKTHDRAGARRDALTVQGTAAARGTR